MTNLILFSSIVLFVCIFTYTIFSKFGIPMLLIFICIGLLFGESELLRIQFDNYNLSQTLCSISLIFIIFYGGFGTKISHAHGIIKPALILSTLGVFLTAGLTAIFCIYILKLDTNLSLLIGAVLSSTDAASVFSILRSHNLNLKYKTAPLLEIESGSNDPFAYVITFAILMSTTNFSTMLIKQVVFALFVGFLVHKLTKILITTCKNIDISFSMAFLVSMVLLTYSLTDLIGGNGYIAVYLFGILTGEIKFYKKHEIASFFNGTTSIMQMVIFFLLGLLASPTNAIKYLPYSIAIMLALTIVIRPLVVFLLMKPFKAKLNQISLISFAGLRGVASVVFSLFCININEPVGYIVFNISFIVVLLSISIQGFLLPKAAKYLNMIEKNGNVLKTFNDYADEEDIDFITLEIQKNHEWIGKKIKDINIIPSILIVLIKRKNDYIIPNGNTLIEENDSVIICGTSFIDSRKHFTLLEIIIDENSEHINKLVKDFNKNFLIVMIKRNDKPFIPDGTTMIEKDDLLVLLEKNT